MKEKFNSLVKGLIVNLPFILVLIGLASFIFAAFLFNQILGYVILGIALILIAYIISPQTAKGR